MYVWGRSGIVVFIIVGASKHFMKERTEAFLLIVVWDGTRGWCVSMVFSMVFSLLGWWVVWSRSLDFRTFCKLKNNWQTVQDKPPLN